MSAFLGPCYRRKATTLVVYQAEAPASKLFSEDSIVFTQVPDYLHLTLIYPAGDRNQKEPEWMKDSLGAEKFIIPSP